MYSKKIVGELFMYVHSVKLVNYKSIGDYDENEIVLEPRITTIIGKNESGKSNVVEGMSKIKFGFKNDNAFADELINRSNPLGLENKYIITLYPAQMDLEAGISEKTVIELTKYKGVITGGILGFYRDNFYNLFVKVLEFLKDIGNDVFRFNKDELRDYEQLIQEMLDDSYINFYNIMNFLRILEKRSGHFSVDKQSDLNRYINLMKDKWNLIVARLPIFFYRRSDKSLKGTYTLDEVRNEFKKEYNTSLLKDFIKLAGVTEEEFLISVKASTSSIAESLRDRIQRNVDANINVKFGKFYKTERVYLKLSFNNDSVSFLVRTEEGEALKLTERSTGLRWCLETFIDAQANDVTGRNIVYLIDEPGITLHVNAQKELQKKAEQNIFLILSDVLSLGMTRRLPKPYLKEWLITQMQAVCLL